MIEKLSTYPQALLCTTNYKYINNYNVYVDDVEKKSVSEYSNFLLLNRIFERTVIDWSANAINQYK